MQKKTKLIGNIIFMLLLLGATMYLLLKDQDQIGRASCRERV